MRIDRGDLDDPRIIALIEIHLARAQAETAPGSSHGLDVSALRSHAIDFWAIWDGEQDGRLLGVGALKRLSPSHGEIKSMHVAEMARGRGVGTLMLRHLIARAGEDGLTRLSLETGSWPYFKPARDFYRRHGFVECPPFCDYVDDPNSVFMTRDLDQLDRLSPPDDDLREP